MSRLDYHVTAVRNKLTLGIFSKPWRGPAWAWGRRS